MNISIKYEDFSEDIFNKYENIRMNAYQVDSFNNSKDYLLKLLTRRMLIVGLYIDNNLIAGCYVSGYRDYLFIDQLFVLFDYQNKGLKLGRLLLNDIIDNRVNIEEFFNKKYSEVKLFSYDDKSSSLYKKLGFKSVGESTFMIKDL